jgi:1-deoxy-D-xylulose 5-phosphate reductoisomerase
MNCPKCNALMNMTVQIGISCPSALEGKFTKDMFKYSNVQIEYANWDTARYHCLKCGYDSGSGIGNYITKLEDKIKKLENQMVINNWYADDKRRKSISEPS